MSEYLVRGGKPLYGSITAQGSKNSAVAILMACIAVHGKVILWRVPFITDVHNCIEILRRLGAGVEWRTDGSLSVDCTDIKYTVLSSDVTAKIRASTYLMGACLNRFGKCDISASGGCALGARPIDIHLGVLRGIGATVCGDTLILRSAEGVVEFPRVTVGGTVNALLAAACGDGVCVFKNCAKEPHVCDLISFLNACGADIVGGGGDVITVNGVRTLHGCEFTISGDMIEAGTYLLVGAATCGQVTVKGVCPFELVSLCQMLMEMGYSVTCGEDEVSVCGNGGSRVYIETGEFPFFPTDMHPQTVALMGGLPRGGSLRERVFGENRFEYLGELAKLGLIYNIEGDTVNVLGGGYSHGRGCATDLRGGAALVIAALAADGESVIERIEHIERGYSDFILKLRSLGADISYGGG